MGAPQPCLCGHPSPLCRTLGGLTRILLLPTQLCPAGLPTQESPQTLNSASSPKRNSEVCQAHLHGCLERPRGRSRAAPILGALSSGSQSGLRITQKQLSPGPCPVSPEHGEAGSAQLQAEAAQVAVPGTLRCDCEESPGREGPGNHCSERGAADIRRASPNLTQTRPHLSGDGG